MLSLHDKYRDLSENAWIMLMISLKSRCHCCSSKCLLPMVATGNVNAQWRHFSISLRGQ